MSDVAHILQAFSYTLIHFARGFPGVKNYVVSHVSQMLSLNIYMAHAFLNSSVALVRFGSFAYLLIKDYICIAPFVIFR